jgi:hypothetical protein
MSDSDDNIMPFRLPQAPSAKVPKESFGERLRRRRDQLSSGNTVELASSWQLRSRRLTALVIESPHTRRRDRRL